MNLSFRGPCNFPIRKLVGGAIAAGAGLLAACGSPIGSGIAPQYIVITNASSTTVTPLQTEQVYECLTSTISAYLYFSNGAVGNYSARVLWSSSNPGAVEVSNGNILVPGQTSTYYPAGTLIGVGTGNAVITADYDGIESSVPVSVSAPQDIKIKAILYGDYIPLDTLNDVGSSSSSSGGSAFVSGNGGSFTIGQGTAVQLAATALLNGVETDVSAYATFGFQLPNPGVATYVASIPVGSSSSSSSSSSGSSSSSSSGAAGSAVGGSGGPVLEGVNPGGPLSPEVSFPPCALTNITSGNYYSFYVSRVSSISLLPVSLLPAGSSSSSSGGSSSSSSGSSSSGSSSGTLPQLIVGNTEEFKVIANLAPTPVTSDPNSLMQDVSSASTLTSSNPTLADFIGGPGTAGNNILHALVAGGPVYVSAIYKDGGEYLTSQTLSTSTLSSVLSQIETCWSALGQTCTPTTASNPQTDASLQAGCLTPTVQYHAFGTYDVLDASGNEIVQEITRQTTWSSSNTAVAVISNNEITAGQPTGVPYIGGAVQIEALDSTAINVPQQFSSLMVEPVPEAADQPTPCP